MESCKCQNQKLQTNFKDFMCKLCKLKHVHECLNHILQFLKDYLPLANSHTNEFITNNTWETFLPENIRDELSSMCDEHLIGLPSYHRTIQTNKTNRSQAEKEREKVEGNSVDDFTIKENMCTIVSGCSVMGIERENVAKKFNSHGKKFSGGYSKKNMNIDCQKDDKDYKVVTNSLINSCVTCENNFITVPGQGHDSPIFSCPYFDQAPKVNGKHKLIKGFPPNWVHRDLTSFLREAESNTLEHFNLALSLKEFYSKLSVPIDDDKIFIPHIMNMKKSHEVDVMGEVCSHLAKKYGTNLIVDMGSGKGYLSTQLALQYGLVVIGIDAMSINTDGAQKRAGKLVKHWNGLVRNATEDKIRGYKVKRSKKLKKKLKREALKKKENKTEIKESSQISDVYCTVSEELPDFQNLFHDFTDGCQTLESHSAEDNEPTVVNSMSKLNDNHSDLKSLKEEIKCCNELGTDIQTNIGLEVNQRDIKLEPGTATESNIQSYQNLHFKQNKDETNTSSDLTTSNKFCQSITKSTEKSTISYHEEIFDSSMKEKTISIKEHEKLYPLTMFVSPDLNLKDIVDVAFEEYDETCTKKCEIESGLMLTGLHTCGALGSSILKLFVNNPQAKILCNVACCYHLMEEEFVCAPFDDGEGSSDEEPGFPLSKYLKDRKVGLGRVARNFASQSLIRMATENQLKSKAFPRSLLQKIILDVVGYTKEDWKGLRKLDQKCDNMYQYVFKAFTKFGLPTEKLTPELVNEYQERYKEEERKLAVFHNLKSVVAPCIETVVILDRMCYLLEQTNVSDVDLVQLFDPMISPRCYGIIAYKKEELSAS